MVDSIDKIKLHECRDDITKYNIALQTADIDTLRKECLSLCLTLNNLQVIACKLQIVNENESNQKKDSAGDK